MCLPLLCVRLYHANDRNINTFHTYSLVANLEWLYIKYIMRVERDICLREKIIEQNLSFAIHCAPLSGAIYSEN